MPHTPSRKSKDRQLVDEHIAMIKANTVTRQCMCCREEFKTDQAYRLCETHRRHDAWFMPDDYGRRIEPSPNMDGEVLS